MLIPKFLNEPLLYREAVTYLLNFELFSIFDAPLAFFFTNKMFLKNPKPL